MTTQSEASLLALLRRWKCSNPDCGREHNGAPVDGSGCRYCPDCRAASARTHECVAVLGDDAEAASYVVISKRPTRGKLASMALRYDRAIFAPTQQIGDLTHADGSPVMFSGQSKTQIAATVITMSQLYEEAAE